MPIDVCRGQNLEYLCIWRAGHQCIFIRDSNDLDGFRSTYSKESLMTMGWPQSICPIRSYTGVLKSGPKAIIVRWRRRSSSYFWHGRANATKITYLPPQKKMVEIEHHWGIDDFRISWDGRGLPRCLLRQHGCTQGGVCSWEYGRASIFLGGC